MPLAPLAEADPELILPWRKRPRRAPGHVQPPRDQSRLAEIDRFKVRTSPWISVPIVARCSKSGESLWSGPNGRSIIPIGQKIEQTGRAITSSKSPSTATDGYALLSVMLTARRLA